MISMCSYKPDFISPSNNAYTMKRVLVIKPAKTKANCNSMCTISLTISQFTRSASRVTHTCTHSQHVGELLSL